MRISVFGAGYVGAVSAGCLAKEGHTVIAVDPDRNKVLALQQGRAPILEPGLDELVAEANAGGRLAASVDPEEAVLSTDLSLVCVGTPSLLGGSIDTTFLSRVSKQIGKALGKKESFHSVVVRSTCVPGTTKDIVLPALERSSRLKAGIGFGVGYLPEFMRESTAIHDYQNPGVIVFGRYDRRTLQRLQSLYRELDCEKFVVDIPTAEAVKYVNNAWHAAKISFSNEIGRLCKALHVDSHPVMQILCADKKLNISLAYMRPGFAFGGSCLPKDLRAIISAARALDCETPLLEATLQSNEAQIQHAYDLIAASGKRKVGIVGLSFKTGTDDLRESPLVELAERLYGKGFELKIFDPDVQLARLTGTNLRYMEDVLPHLSRLLSDDIRSISDSSEIIVVGSKLRIDGALRQIPEATVIIDLVRLGKAVQDRENYDGICW